MSNIKKHEKMETKNAQNVGNQSINNENRIWIEWSEKTMVSKQFKTLDELMESGLVQKHAANFGMEHIINQKMIGWSKHEIHNIFIVDANPVFNYGLDFKMWIHYTADGINFMAELTIGSSCLSSAPLQRVTLNTKTPDGFDFKNLENNSREMMMEWMRMIDQNEIESFQFSTNVFYKKNAEFRNQLRELSKYPSIIFA